MLINKLDPPQRPPRHAAASQSAQLLSQHLPLLTPCLAQSGPACIAAGVGSPIFAMVAEDNTKQIYS